MSTKISIRMDDITPDMDWTKFMRFKALCDKYRIRPLVGVVPDNQDPNLHRAARRDAHLHDKKDGVLSAEPSLGVCGHRVRAAVQGAGARERDPVRARYQHGYLYGACALL